MANSHVNKGRRSGIIDVALRAGVSRQTVTRAMNDMPGISARTKERVLEAARELHYRPSRFGRGLVTRGAPTLGLVVVDLTNSFWAELASAVLDAAFSRGWAVLIAESSHDARAAVGNLLEHVDAVFGLVDLPEDDVDSILGTTPLLRFDGTAGSGNRAGIRLDFDEGMTAAVAHLVSTGRRRIVMLDWVHSGPPSRRAEAFTDAVVHRGLEPLVLHNVFADEPVMQTGHRAAAEARKRWPDIDAFVCFNDAVAVGAMKQIQQAGLQVPDDIAIVGIDGSSIGTVVTPELTTVSVDMQEVASLAIANLIRIFDGDLPQQGPEVQLTVRPQLIVRASS